MGLDPDSDVLHLDPLVAQPVLPTHVLYQAVPQRDCSHKFVFINLQSDHPAQPVLARLGLKSLHDQHTVPLGDVPPMCA